MIYYASLLLIFLNGESRLAERIPAGSLLDCIAVTRHLEKAYLPDPTVQASLAQCEYQAAPD